MKYPNFGKEMVNVCTKNYREIFYLISSIARVMFGGPLLRKCIANCENRNYAIAVK